MIKLRPNDLDGVLRMYGRSGTAQANGIELVLVFSLLASMLNILSQN